MSEKTCRDVVRERSGGDCELRLSACLGRAASVHHRRKRSQGGPWTPSNCLHTCGDGTRGCHGVITDTRTEYYESGWIVHSWDPWASTPVLMHTHFGHTWVLLDDEGGCSLAPFPESDPRHPDDIDHVA